MQQAPGLHCARQRGQTSFNQTNHRNNQVAADVKKLMSEGMTTSFQNVSIVELGFSGNVLREFYRINLADGSAVDVATGQKVR